MRGKKSFENSHYSSGLGDIEGKKSKSVFQHKETMADPLLLIVFVSLCP